jgi:hypothetical protein
MVRRRAFRTVFGVSELDFSNPGGEGVAAVSGVGEGCLRA